MLATFGAANCNVNRTRLAVLIILTVQICQAANSLQKGAAIAIRPGINVRKAIARESGERRRSDSERLRRFDPQDGYRVFS